MTAEQMSNMSNTEKKLDVICLGAAVVDIPLRPVSRDIFDIESYPVDRIATVSYTHLTLPTNREV